MARLSVSQPRGLELEVIALRHQPSACSPASPGSRPDSTLLHRSAPVGMALPTMAAVSGRDRGGEAGHRDSMAPARLSAYWRWRSKSGGPSVDCEVRDQIRQMSNANPLWGAPRIHGELLKLGIEISQAHRRQVHGAK